MTAVVAACNSPSITLATTKPAAGFQKLICHDPRQIIEYNDIIDFFDPYLSPRQTHTFKPVNPTAWYPPGDARLA